MLTVNQLTFGSRVAHDRWNAVGATHSSPSRGHRHNNAGGSSAASWAADNPNPYNHDQQQEAKPQQ